MNTFLQRGFHEYTRQSDLKRNFASHNELVFRLFEKPEPGFYGTPKTGAKESLYLLLLAPLVETAWADGRVTARESDAILLTADCYGLTADENLYGSLIETMLSRPSPKMTARNWHQLQQLFIELPPDKLEMLGESLLVQAQYIAGQSSNNLIAFLRGDLISRDEEAVLQNIGEELEKARRARERRVEKLEKGFEKLLPLVPLVKVAWAEGRITKRERRIILDAATKRFGIDPDSLSYRRLLDWLELRPTDDFYNESLEILSRQWDKLDAHERALRSLDVLSDCALVAEASGGNPNYPAGGERVCEEEATVMRRIEQKLNGRRSPAYA